MEIKSQTNKIKEYLLAGNTLTSLEALKFFGCLRLSGRIHDLRCSGVNVVSQMVKINGKKVAEYRINIKHS